MRNARIRVRLDAETQRRLEEEIAATGQSASDVVRQALTAYFDKLRRPSCLELAQQLGLIGCAKVLPPDLSTNRRYFEGYGR